MSFKKNVIHTFCTRTFLQVFSLVNSIICARVLGPDGYGSSIMLLIFPPIVVELVNLGLAGSLTYYVGQYQDSKKIYIGTALVFAFFVAVFSTILLLLLHQPIVTYYYKDVFYSNLFLIIIFFTPVYTVELYLSSIMKSLNMIKEINYIRSIFSTVLTSLLIIILIGFLGNNVETVIYINLSTQVVIVVIMGIILFKRDVLSICFDKKKFLSMLSFGLRGYFTNFSDTLNDKLDKVIIGTFLTPDQVGIYSIAVNIVSKIKIIPRSVGLPLYPEIAKSTKAYASLLVQKLMQKFLLVLVPLIVIMVVVSHDIIEFLYGNIYTSAYTPLIFLAVETVFLSFNKTLGYYYVGTGRPGARSIQRLILMIFNCLLMLILLPILGITGCSLSVLTSSVIVFLGTYYFFLKNDAKPYVSIFSLDIRQFKSIFKK